MSERRDAPSNALAPSDHRRGIEMSDDAAVLRSRITEGATVIVTAYVANNRVPHSGLPALIALVGQSLTDAVTSLRQCKTSTIRKATKSEIQASITRDRIISFIDGKPYKALRRHLTVKGYTAQSYRALYGLPVDYPMVAPSYSEQRSEISRQIGLRKRSSVERETLQ